MQVYLLQLYDNRAVEVTRVYTTLELAKAWASVITDTPDLRWSEHDGWWDALGRRYDCVISTEDVVDAMPVTPAPVRGV